MRNNCFVFPDFFSRNVGNSIKCEKNITPPPPPNHPHIWDTKSEQGNRGYNGYTVQITFIFIDFRVCDFAFAFKTQNAPCVSVLNVFYFQTDFNLRFKRKRDVRLTCHRVWCILHRTLLTQMAMRLTSHIIVQMDMTSAFGN